MPIGVYPRTEKHSFNRGRKHPNRKPYFKGMTKIHKVCPQCMKDFETDCLQPKKKFCSQSCSSKSRPAMNLANLNKRDKEVQRLSVASRIGELHPLWIKDRSKLKDDSKDRKGSLSRDWSRRIKQRDCWKCRLHNEDCVGRLESHHILGWKSHPHLRYEDTNGITLCHHHHPRKRADEEKMIPVFQEILKTL